MSSFKKLFWHDGNAPIESNLQIVNLGNLSTSNPNHADVSDTQHINVFINEEKFYTIFQVPLGF